MAEDADVHGRDNDMYYLIPVNCCNFSGIAPAASITVLEAGADESANPLCIAPLACFGAHHSPLDWAYTTAPQKHLRGRRCYAAAGRALGGSSAINDGTWTRGAKEDYDA